MSARYPVLPRGSWGANRATTSCVGLPLPVKLKLRPEHENSCLGLPPRPLDDGEGLVDLLAGYPQVR
jgi:hypothetical protein